MREAFRLLLTGNAELYRIIFRSLAISGAASLLAMMVGIPLGYALARGRFPGRTVLLSAVNTGMGMPPDILAKVFDPFFTTKPVGKGTGLGLSQVHGFAHQAGGTVRVSSDLGKGTTITIYLPRSASEAGSIDTDEVPARDARTGSVLLVEDNPEVANASTGLFEQLGYSVRWVSNAEAALREIDKNGFELVVSDIVMPGKLDGLGLAQAIKAKHPSLPILLTTGYSEAAQSAGATFPILRKPYALHELSRALAELRHD